MKPGKSTIHFTLTPVTVPPIASRFRTIQTAIPHPEDITIFNTIRMYESSLLDKQLPIVWDHADGYQIYDRWGNKWIDLSSTIFVTNSGHASPKIKQRLKTVFEKGLFHAYCYPTQERSALLKKLIEITPPYIERACLVTTGTEASERALKLARLYGMTHSPRKTVIIGGLGNYHGKTMGAMMSAVTPEAREWIGFQDPNMLHLPFPYPWILEQEKINGKELFERHIHKLIEDGLDPNTVSAFIIESYQGWGAVFYPKEYVQAMSEWAKAHKALLIIDEIQSGFGRTGKLFGYEHYHIEPDLVCCGKGISGSLPLSAVVGRGDLIELDPTLTSTHGGHPMACAAALGNLESLVDDGLIARAEILGPIIENFLLSWQKRFPDRIPQIMGKGMVWAVYITFPGTQNLDANFTDRLIERAMQKGVYSIRTGCGTIKLGPPLNIDIDAFKEAIDVYIESMTELIGENNR